MSPLTGQIFPISSPSEPEIVLHSWSEPYSYIGKAKAGTEQTSSGWEITRIEVASNGITTVLTANGIWNNRVELFPQV